MKKTRYFYSLWNQVQLAFERLGTAEKYDYSDIDELEKFEDSHPRVMQELVKNQNWEFTYDPSQKARLSLKRRFLDAFEKRFGYRIGEYKNYSIVKDTRSS